MTREEIITATKIPNSGDLTTKLEELESCGFIRKYNAFGMNMKNAIFQQRHCCSSCQNGMKAMVVALFHCNT